MKECRESPILHILSGDNRGDEEDLHWAVVFHTSSINPNIFQLDARNTGGHGDKNYK